MERLRTCQAILPIIRHSYAKPDAFCAWFADNSIKRITLHSNFLSDKIFFQY